jgi:hypothetical protein
MLDDTARATENVTPGPGHETHRSTRRGLLAGLVAGLAAAIAGALGRSVPTAAANGDPLILGQSNSSTLGTHLGASSGGISVLSGSNDVALSGRSPAGIGVHASSTTGTGLYASTGGGPGIDVLAEQLGIRAVSESNVAVRGQTTGNSTAVFGYSGTGDPPAPTSKTGVYGYAAQDANARGLVGGTTAGWGVSGTATSGTGVRGASTSGEGVRGVSSSSNGTAGSSGSPIATGAFGVNTGGGYGTYGRSNAPGGFGAYGEAQQGTGVTGHTGSSTLPGVHGFSIGGSTGVVGRSSTNPAPPTPAGTGVFGYADLDGGSVGVHGASPSGRGGIFSGGQAALRLRPAGSTHPSSGIRGDLVVDTKGRLWFCRGGSIWVRLA